MAKFDLGEFLRNSGVQIDTERREQIEYISRDLIVPDPNNFYELSGLDDLAANIALLGLQQPIRVRQAPGGDGTLVIISGHRRFAAICKLIDEDGRDDLRDIPCIVETGEENPNLTQLKLIYANAATRVLSGAEMARQAQQVEELLYKLKADGMEFPGRMRDHVAQACKVSTGKLARLKVIRSQLIPPFMRLWEADKLRESVAYSLATLPPVRQRGIYIFQTDDGKREFCCTDGWVQSIASEMDRMELICKETTCPETGADGCAHVYCRINHAASLSQYSSMSCRGCCCDCYYLASCRYSCEHAITAKREIKEQERTRKAEEKAAQKAKDLPAKEMLTGCYARVKRLREQRNVTSEDFIKASLGSYFIMREDELRQLESGKADLRRRMPGGIWAEDAIKLVKTAELLGCSVDFLLGRNVEKEPNWRE